MGLTRKQIAVRLKVYDILADKVEEGVRVGLMRAYKHTDAPTREQLEEHLHREVMCALSEVLDY